MKQKEVCLSLRRGYISHRFLDEEKKCPAKSWNKARLADSIALWKGVAEDWALTWRVKKTKNIFLERVREIDLIPTYKIQKIGQNLMMVTLKQNFISSCRAPQAQPY